jgi:hypothetical protein
MKKLIITAISLCAVGVTTAQDDISKQMEVTRAYTPHIGQATKLTIIPQMVDTVRLRPEVRYTITPTAWQTVFETTKYAPARLDIAPFQKQTPFYVRAGLGYPLMSTADFYYNPYMGNGSTFGVWLNHRGSFSHIENEVGLKPPSTEMLNEAGLYGSKYFGRYRLEGEVSYDNRLYSAYGAYNTLDLSSYGKSFVEADPIMLGRIAGRITFGDTFTNLERLNFGVGVNLGAAHEDESFYQFDFDGWAKVGQMFGTHGFEVELSERSAIKRTWGLDGGSFEDWGSAAVNLSPRYLFSFNKLELRAGVGITYIKNALESGQWIPSPLLSMKYEMAEGAFVPYLTLSSELVDGSREALTRQNPYLTPYSSASTPMGWTYNGRIGASGLINELFTYRVWGGVSQLNNMVFFVGTSRDRPIISGNTITFYPHYFTPISDNGTLYSAGFEVGVQNWRGFSVSLHSHLYKYLLDELSFAVGKPSWEVGMRLDYKRRGFAIWGEVEFMGKRQFLDYTLKYEYDSGSFNGEIRNSENVENLFSTTSVGATINISLGAEYNFSDTLGFFVEGRNLANQRLYPYGHYAGLGASVMVGIKTTF